MKRKEKEVMPAINWAHVKYAPPCSKKARKNISVHGTSHINNHLDKEHSHRNYNKHEDGAILNNVLVPSS